MNCVVLMYVLAGLLVAAGCNLASAKEYRVVRSFPIASEPACMPAVTRAPNGDLLVVFSTEWEPMPAGGVLKLVVSKDNAGTWSEPRVLWRHEDPRITIQVSNGLETLSNGEILLPVNVCLIPKRKDVDPGEKRPVEMHIFDPNHPDYRRDVRLLRSGDNGRTWAREDPKFTPSLVLSFARLLETQDGRLIKPAYWGGAAWYYESRDFGKTWGPRIMLHKRFFTGSNIVEAADGTLFLFGTAAAEPPRRTFGISFSRDGGKTWSEARSAGIQGKMPDLLVLPSGRILMVVGAEGVTDGSQVRKQMDRYSFSTLFISDDHGQTWKRDLAFEQVTPGGSVVPADGPSLCQLSDGRILVVIQAMDRSKGGHPLFGFSEGMSIIGNIIEPIDAQRLGRTGPE